MEGCKTSPTFRYYQEALGKDNIKLAVVDESDDLSFLKAKDIILLRTASSSLIHTIYSKHVRTTAELYDKYTLTSDKVSLHKFLGEYGILTPSQYKIDGIVVGKKYFVKPRYGNDSIGVSNDSICSTTDEVRNKAKSSEVVIEDYIEGKEYTVACIKTSSSLRMYAIEVDCSSTDGIQTYEGKKNYLETGIKVDAETRQKLQKISSKVFKLLGIRHHARIDFRSDNNGNLYVIDVNLIPGLGPIGDMARCLLLSENYSYIDMLNLVISSAT